MIRSAFCLALAVCITRAAGVFAGAPASQWIGTQDLCWDWRSAAKPAPTFRRVFTLQADVAKPRLAICGLGFFDCRVDGLPVTDGLLMPGETQYDVRWRYRVFELPPLGAGRHVISVTVGDGLYHGTTREVWHFDKASWMDYPKLVCELRDAAGAVLVRTDPDWRWRPSPTTFTALRGGESYDARLAFSETDSPDAEWRPVRIVAPPGGFGEEETFPPCRVIRTVPMTRRGGTVVWEAPRILTGNVRIRVKGAAGARVTVIAGERLSADGTSVDQRPINAFADYNERRKTFQRCCYTAAGSGEETWSPRFLYQGFQYAEIHFEGAVEPLAVEALEIHTDFARTGCVEPGDPIVGRVAAACENSFLGNFHNIPTDCPHREKNGWTSESRLMCEAGLYSFDAGAAYAAFADLVGDTQRGSGQISGIAPSAGWGYNWGAGPAWDTALFEIPDAVYRFTGDRGPIDRLYPKMVRYLDFVEGMLDAQGVPSFGLGDWLSASGCCYEPFVRAAFRIRNLAYGERFARLLGKTADASRFAERRAAAVDGFRRTFCGADGVSSAETSFPHAAMLDLDLVEPSRREACARRLAEIIERNGARVDYGTLGSRCVLRALFDNGHADLAYRMMTQPACPGYAFITETLKLQTLPERWDVHKSPETCSSSLNHGAFADYLAVLYRHLGGLRHVFERPGRNYVEIRPAFPVALPHFACEHEGFRVAWTRKSGTVDVTVTVPPGKNARYFARTGTAVDIGPGNHRFRETDR